MKYFVEVRLAESGRIIRHSGPHPDYEAALRAKSCINRTLNHIKFYTHIATE